MLVLNKYVKCPTSTSCNHGGYYSFQPGLEKKLLVVPEARSPVFSLFDLQLPIPRANLTQSLGEC